MGPAACSSAGSRSARLNDGGGPSMTNPAGGTQASALSASGSVMLLSHAPAAPAKSARTRALLRVRSMRFIEAPGGSRLERTGQHGGEADRDKAREVPI